MFLLAVGEVFFTQTIFSSLLLWGSIQHLSESHLNKSTKRNFKMIFVLRLVLRHLSEPRMGCRY